MGARYNAVIGEGERANNHYKGMVFRLSLYNALSTRCCDNVDGLKVVTLENAIYMEVKNDIVFLIDTDIHLWEYQSTMQRSARRAERKGHKRKPSLQRGAFHGIQVAGTVCKDDVLA